MRHGFGNIGKATKAPSKYAYNESVSRSAAPEPLAIDYRRLFDLAPALILVLDPSFTIVAVTDAYLNATMTQRDQIVGKHLFEVFPDNPDDPNASGVRNLTASLEAVLRYKVTNKMNIQKYDIRKVGSEEFEERFWAPVNTPMLNADGEVELIMHRADDVTEMMRLGRAETDLDRFFDVSLDMLCIASSDGRFKRVSPAFTDTLGWSQEQLTTTPFLEFIHPDDIQATINEVDRQIRTGEQVLQFENRYKHMDGTWRTLSWKSMPQPDGLMYATARDVTQAREAQRELEEAREAADRANTAKSEFLSRMSHELRTPLNAVIGYAQLLKMRSYDAKIQDSAHAILKGGHHLLSLINEILDLARIEAGKLTLSLEPVEVKAAIEHALDLVRPTADSQGIEIEIGGDPIEDIFVMADRQRLVQVLLNLLSNAIKFNRPAGQVKVSFYQTDREYCRIEVADTGMGIDDEQTDRLFKPFERLGSESIEGTGLGLALSSSLAQLMGGAIALVSTSPQGSTFAIALKSAEPPSTNSIPVVDLDERRANEEGTKLRVIYIEDNLSNIEFLETVFEEIGGVDLITAMQASVGVSLIEDHVPDLVLLDLNLPDSHGSEVLKKLKANPRTWQIPVIVISADATHMQIKRLMEAGAKAYLTKPIDLPTLFKEIDDVRASLG